MGEGWGVYMLAYRGYAGSSGSPSETANVADARLAYGALVEEGVDPASIIIYGESLGTGVAVRLATERPAAGLILDAPYTSIVEIAARAYFYLPVRYLLKDRYETRKYIAQVHMPLLILHGERDAVIPVGNGRELLRLGKRAQAPGDLPQRRPQRHLRQRQSRARRGQGLDRPAEAHSPAVPLSPKRHGPAREERGRKLQDPYDGRTADALPRAAEAATTAEPTTAAKAAAARRTAGTGGARRTAARTSARPGARLDRRLARQQTLALGALARQLARPPHRFRLLAHALLGGLLVVVAQLHLAEDALALHLLLQRLESLIDVVVADLNQQAVYLEVG